MSINVSAKLPRGEISRIARTVQPKRNPSTILRVLRGEWRPTPQLAKEIVRVSEIAAAVIQLRWPELLGQEKGEGGGDDGKAD